RNAELVEEMAEGIDVGEAREVGERQLLIGEKRAGHQCQRGVFRAADRDLALEALSAFDPDAVHRRGLARDGSVTSGRWVRPFRACTAAGVGFPARNRSPG